MSVELNVNIRYKDSNTDLTDAKVNLYLLLIKNFNRLTVIEEHIKELLREDSDIMFVLNKFKGEKSGE